jgi:hypothetical protein
VLDRLKRNCRVVRFFLLNQDIRSVDAARIIANLMKRFAYKKG